MSKDMPDRLPPHSQDAEQGVLGCFLIQTDQKRLLEQIGHPDTPGALEFYDLRHREIFTQIKAMADARRVVDMITLAQALSDDGKLEAVGGYVYLNTLADKSPSAEALPEYAAIVREKARLRKVLELSGRLARQAYESEDASVILENAERDILEVCHGTRRVSAKTMKELVLETIEILDKEVTEGRKALATGFPDLDKLSGGGFHNGEMVVIAGRPSLGKTALAMNIAEHVAESAMRASGALTVDEYKGPHVLVFSLEMKGQALSRRMLESRAQIPLFEPKNLGDRDYPRVTNAAGQVATLPIIIEEDSSLTLAGICSLSRMHHARHTLNMIVVDYLQLVNGEPGARGSDRRVQVDTISRGLKALAKEIDIPVLVLCQLNRACESEDRKPRVSDLRESGQIEQDGDFVGLLWHPTELPENETKPVSREVALHIGKQRNGPSGPDVQFIFRSNIFRFFSAAPVSHEDPQI